MKDEDVIIDYAFKGICCAVVGIVSYIFLRLINFDAESAIVISSAGSVVMFLLMVKGT